MHDDQELARLATKAQSGDREAEARLLAALDANLVGEARAASIPGWSREDLVAEARMKAVLAVRSWREGGGRTVRNYTLHVVRNRFRDLAGTAYSRSGEPSAVRLDEPGGETGDPMHEAVADPDAGREARARDATDALESALDCVRGRIVAALEGDPTRSDDEDRQAVLVYVRHSGLAASVPWKVRATIHRTVKTAAQPCLFDPVTAWPLGPVGQIADGLVASAKAVAWCLVDGKAPQRAEGVPASTAKRLAAMWRKCAPDDDCAP